MKKNIALLVGGYSKEYEVSIESGKVIAKNIDSNLYNVFKIIISREGWYYFDENYKNKVDLNDFSVVLNGNKIRFDAVFIGIHGSPGEDGILQSYFDMMKIPYNTCGKDSSMLTFNKYFANKFVETEQIVKVAESYYLNKFNKVRTDEISAKIGFPCFVKPNKNGSSIGISKVNKIDELSQAIEKAFNEDDEVIIQKSIDGIELGCGLYQKNNKLVIFPLTEIVSYNSFFDYEAKYTKGKSEEITPARIAIEIADRCKEISAILYRKMNCRGIVRADYIYVPVEKQFYFIEINTVPGLSDASIVPKQAACAGLPLMQLFTDVIEETLKYH